MKKLIYLLIATLMVFGSCQPQKKHKKHKKLKVKELKVHSKTVDNDPLNDWLFYYVILNNDSKTGGCYTYSSPTQVTDFKSVNWTESKELPQELTEFADELADNTNTVNETTIENDIEVNVEDLSVEMQTEIDMTPEYFGGMTVEEMGDYEGTGSYNDDEAEADTDASDSDSGSDSGGDSGGGDSGGGDGGGGDGGGGGE